MLTIFISIIFRFFTNFNSNSSIINICAMTETTTSADFIVDDCFADDDLLTSEEYNNIRAIKQDQQLRSQKSFLERDNFETELGTANDDPFAENFAEIENNDIIDVYGEDVIARPVVVIYAHRFPSNKGFDHDKFLRFVKYTLDKIVDQDYTIIYFHYGLRSNNKPPLKWLIRAYQLLDRRYRKNLKALYVVHPTKFIRFIWSVFKPIISLKFEQKLHYLNSLEELNAIIPTANLNLPQPIIDFDRSSNLNVQKDHQPQRQINLTPRPTQQFNVSLKFILDHNPNSDIPPIAAELIDFIREHGLSMEGIFRRSVNVNMIKSLQNRINMGEKINFLDDSEINGDLEKCILHASVLLKTFLRSLGEPLTTNHLYPELILLSAMEKSTYLDATREFLQKLPLENYLLLKKVVHLLTDVAKHSEQNLMTANNLSIIFGPVLHWPTDQQVPMAQIRSLNAFSYNLILNFEELFCDNH